MFVQSLENPLGVATLVNDCSAALNAANLYITTSNNMRDYERIKQTARNLRPCPLFDPDINDFENGRAFWMSLENAAGQTVALQAYRKDMVETSLANWCAPYMIGVYMQRGEMLVPSHAQAPKGSISTKLRGAIVYHGELWADKSVRPRTMTDTFSKLGQLLCMIKWNPDAIWALTSNTMASHGYPGKLGYTYVERGFLRWEWTSEAMEPVEYLCVIDREGLSQYVDEALTTEPKFQLSLARS